METEQVLQASNVLTATALELLCLIGPKAEVELDQLKVAYELVLTIWLPDRTQDLLADFDRKVGIVQKDFKVSMG